ncbi:hypothetical protein [Nocardia crassostreae]|uniref:hypothetical protein n=1 Tax=Nocardia crassostreae TaxID=53428 RepID=UPI00082AE143|nr:hypothetical protein [Nocardia crassostreae]
MAQPKPFRRNRIVAGLGFLALLGVVGLIARQGLPHDDTVLRWGDDVVAPGDWCREIGGQNREGSCGTLAQRETRPVGIVAGYLIVAGVAVPVLFGGATYLVIRARRTYRIIDDIPVLDLNAELLAHDRRFGNLRQSFLLVRGAGLCGYDRVVVAHYAGGLVRQDNRRPPRAYTWPQVSAIRRIGRGAGEYEHILTFADDTALPVRGAYREPAIGVGLDTESRFAVFLKCLP